MVAIGDAWEGHELLNELDRGMVRTFLARQLGDAKELVWLHVREGARIERGVFASEIERLQRISEEVPQVVRVLYGGIRGSVAWAASPVHTGAIRLKDATRAADLGLTAVKMLIELGQSLVRAHELGAVHGALSPERVLIAAGSGYAITHFGFVRLFQLAEDDALREPCHAAPELIFGGRLGKRTDVYGFGTVMYELLCRRELYSDEEHRRLCDKTWEPRFPDTVPPVLRCVMKKALAREPKDRYPSVEQMLTVLVAIADAWEALGRAPGSFDERSEDPTVASSSAGRPSQHDDAWEPFVRDAAAPLAAPAPPRTLGLDRRSAPSAVSIDVPRLQSPPPSPIGTPEPSPSPPSAEVLAVPVRGRAHARRRAPVRLLGKVLALGAALGAAGAFVWWQRAPRAVPLLAHAVRPAALRHLAPCLLGPAAAPQETLAASPPAEAWSLVSAEVAVAPKPANRPWHSGIEPCDGIYAGYLCGRDRY